MPEFNLKPEQIGEIASDGTIAKHPELDIMGSPYDTRSATRKRLTHNGKRVFVVIPPGKDSEGNKYNLPGGKATPKADS